MLPSFVQCHEKQLERVSFSISRTKGSLLSAGADLGGGCRECAPLPPPPPEMNCGFLIQLVFFIGVEVEQETSAPPPKKFWIRPCSVLQHCYDWVQPYTQASSRYPSDQRSLETERDSARRPRRIFPTSLTGDVASEIAEDDWERQQMLCLLKLFNRGYNEIMRKVYRTTVPNVF